MAVESSPARLVILDGHGIIFRAYFAMREPLVVKHSGEVVSAVYGFANTLLRVVDELHPTHVILTMDTPAPTFRHEADATYKAHRPDMPADLPPQIDRCREVARAFNIPILEADGFEADDVLATLADQAVDADMETWIATLDSDLIQLVRPGVNVFMFRPYQRDTVRYDSDAKVRDRYGIDPVQMIDFKGLKGDASDNIPGVPGIGEKTAIKLLNAFGSMYAIYEHLDEVTPLRAQKALREHREEAEHSRWMATIVHDAPVLLDLDASRWQDFDRSTVRALFEEFEFRSLLARVPESPADADSDVSPVDAAADAAESVPSPGYQILRDAASLTAWLETARTAPLLAVDLETSSLDTIGCEIAGYALAAAPVDAVYVPVRHADDGEPMLAPDVARDLLRPVLEDAAVPKVLHNAKFDLKVLRQAGVTLAGVQHDTMLAAYLLGEPSVGLKALALARLGVEMTPIQDLIGAGKKQISMTEVPAGAAGPYAAADADMTLRLVHLYTQQLHGEPRLLELYRTLELPLVDVLAEMELRGIACEPDVLTRLSATLDSEITEVEQRIFTSVGHEFNVASPKQLSQVLFEELALPKTRKTSQGYTTDAQALERIAEAHPAVELVLQYRELTKLKSTYLDTLPALVHPTDGRIHTDYNQAVAATGRLSSENPNLQNIPVRTEMGREVRSAFVPRNGADVVFLGADYSQIELRVLAHLSGDAGLIEAFRHDEDIHAATASGVYGVEPPDVDPEMRRVAKMMNFGVIYGLTGFGLSQRSGMERAAADAFIAAYFERFTRVREWIEEIKASTHERGYAETLLGRRRYLPAIKSPNFQARAGAERMAINMPVQGTAADVIKRAMLDLWRAIPERNLAARMILQVHDELIFETPEEEAPALAALLHEIMPSAIAMIVPLKIEVKMGPTWRDMTPYGALAAGDVAAARAES